MFKKTLVILSAIIVLSVPFQQQYAESAILSKVATTGAKKAVKEVVKDIAIETAVNFAFGEAYKIVNEGERAKYKLQSEYELFCGKKMPDLITCEKPMQIKGELTDFDKVAIGNQAEIEFDKLITDGKGFTRWQKFLDWFLPIWVLSFATTALTYALDPEVRSLFNEAGYNALVTLGIIKPVYDNVTAPEITGFETVELPPRTIEDGQGENYHTKTGTENQNTSYVSLSGLNIPNENLIIAYEHTYFRETTDFRSQYMDLNGQQYIEFNPNAVTLYNPFFVNVQSMTSAKNGVVYNTSSPVVGADTTLLSTGTSESISTIKGKSVMTRTPYKVGDFYYTDVLFNTSSGDLFTFQIKSSGVNQPDTITAVSGRVNVGDWYVNTRVTVYTNQIASKQPLIPLAIYDEVPESVSKSNYEDDKGQIAIIPPSALPYTQTSTGVALEPKKVGEEITFQTPDGTTVPEEDITVGDPVVTPSPDGTPQVQPPPTPSNPSPEPIPLTPTTPAQPTTPVETEAPIFPEGESCSEGLKFPKFKQLGSTISNGFPFSLPFDIYDGFNNVFADIGTEKPAFEYKFKFMGEEQVWNIALPDYFDSWKRFTDILLVVFFDITLLYLFNRFFGAMGSD